ncbi:MAG TPA: nuclear transport factor 2 family protein [Candidatus Udaeobacter sp.]|jgi:ketosteroid isomerase-like protein|nr:nuclear transport factor 2 family protein [Candidatus Udaeobacter sp.]
MEKNPAKRAERTKQMEEAILKAENEFVDAIARNDVEAIKRFVADDWIIIGADGGIIDRERFLGVIESGALTHELMQCDDMRVRAYEDFAVVTALTRSKGKFMGQEFTTHERSTDVFVRRDEEWRCVLTQLTACTKKET